MKYHVTININGKVYTLPEQSNPQLTADNIIRIVKQEQES